MLILYVSPSCVSSGKVKKWVKQNNIEHIERNLKKEMITHEEIKQILSLTKEGTDEIISKRAKIYSEVKHFINDLKLTELIELIHEHPSLLRRPIMVDKSKMQIGFNEDAIRTFLPRKHKKAYIEQTQKMMALDLDAIA